MQIKYYLALSLLIILVSCTSDANPLDKMTPPPNPVKGQSTVYGMVVDSTNGEPLKSVVVRLAEVHREGEGGVFLLDLGASPGTRTDENGIFVISDFPPGEYVMAVGDGDNFNDYDIVEDPESKQAKVWTAVADQVANWGTSPAQVLFR